MIRVRESARFFLLPRSGAGRGNGTRADPHIDSAMSSNAATTISLSSAAGQSHAATVASRAGASHSSGLVTLRSIISSALPEKQQRRSQPEGDVRHSVALFAALVVYSGVAWL